MSDATNRLPLLPDRHEPDFFLCDVFDAAPKSDLAGMEHPIFSISTKPDLRPRRYESGNNFVEIRPSSDGMATVHDRDVLIFCISQLIAALNDGKEVSRTVRFTARDYLIVTNRDTGGAGYRRLKPSLDRLAGTRIVTNIVTGAVEVMDGFGLIDRYRIVRETREGYMLDIEVTLSEWVFNAIRAHEVLTLSRDYFRLRKPLERRLYEIARKHCGSKPTWRIGLEKLKAKCGSNSTDREFRRLVGKIVDEDEKHDHMPDYAIRFSDNESQVIFMNRGSVPSTAQRVTIAPLDPDVYEMARMAAPGWDVHVIEAEWRAWATEVPRNPEMAFVGFCKKWQQQRGRP